MRSTQVFVFLCFISCLRCSPGRQQVLQFLYGPSIRLALLCLGLQEGLCLVQTVALGIQIVLSLNSK